MKEYEYIVEALDGYLCDELASVIASESYRNRTYELGYRQIFAQYRKLHENFRVDHRKFLNPAQKETAKNNFRLQCQQKRQDIQTRFLRDIQACTSIDMKSHMDLYLKRLEEEEIQTVAKRVCLYPYLVSVLRESLKGEVKSNGNKV